MLPITNHFSLPLEEIEIEATRAQGAGGQKVNKSATAVQLRFDIGASSLPDLYKFRLLTVRDQRITKEGVVVIKAQQHRSQEQNRAEALSRLQELIRSVVVTRKPRRPTQPSRSAREKRLVAKKQRSQIKSWRSNLSD